MTGSPSTRLRRELIERAARVYVANEESWTPTQAVADELGVDLDRARYLVQWARSEGLLARYRARRGR